MNPQGDRLFSTILRSIADAVIATDAEQRVIFMNPVASRLTGWTEVEAANKPLSDVLPLIDPRSGETIECPAAHALREGHSVTLPAHTFLVTKDGRQMPIADSTAPIYDDQGAVIGCVIVFRDITEESKVADDLAQREVRLRIATDAAELGVFVWDLRNDHVEWEHDRTYEMFGRNREEGTINAAEFATQIVHPDDLKLFQRSVAEAMQSGRFHFVGRFRRKDGAARWCEFNGRVEFGPDGSPSRMVGVSADVTDRKQAEAAQLDSEQKFRALAENIPQLAWMADGMGWIFWYNKQWYDYTGTCPEQMEGWGWQSVHDPEVLPRVLEQWKGSIASGAPFEMVFPLKGADGVFRPFLTRVNPVKDDLGRVKHWFGSNTEITERVQMEAALREADRRKDEFLAMLAHELRNPLSSVSNAVQLLRMPKVSAEQAAWSTAVIERQVKHLARLIDDLLDVSRITRGKVELRKEIIDASTIINASVDSIRPSIDQKKQNFEVSFTPGTLWCEVDPTRLEQILINLLTNATRYTETGGHIRLSAKHDGSNIVFKVHDTGVGIPPEKLPEMFELFTQGDRTIARSEGGLGIGLTIVKSIAEMHGGSVIAFSEGTSKGSEFTVTIPAIPKTTPKPVVTTIPLLVGEGKDQSSRILIVDDNVDTARGLSQLLKLKGHEIRTAHDGPTALAEALEFQPEFVLLDIGLPDMDGFQVAQRLRQEVAPDAVIIAVSGYGQEEDRLRSIEAGFNHYLVKPVDHKALVTLILSFR